MSVKNQCKVIDIGAGKSTAWRIISCFKEILKE